MISLDLEWMKDKKWLEYSHGGILCKPKEDAPQHILDSYMRYKKQKAEALKREKENNITLI